MSLSRPFRRTAGSTCAALLSLLILLGCAPDAVPRIADDAPPPAPLQRGQVRLQPPSLKVLEIQPVSAERGTRPVWAPARVVFQDDRVTAVAAPAAGRVVEIHARVGDAVQVGAPLATLASPDAARLRSERAAAGIEARLAAAELQRQTTMLDRGVGTAAEKTAAAARHDAARLEVARADRAAAFVGAGDQDRVVLRSPRDGVVVNLSATAGGMADAGGATLFTIGDPAALWVVADVFESDLEGILPGAAVQMQFSSMAHPVRGRVERVGAALEAETRRAPVYIALRETVAGLRPGALARVGIEVAPGSGLTIPLSAVLIKDERRSIVYVQRGDRPDGTVFEARDVKLGLPLRGAITVLEGLAPGERIVVRGGLLLDGAASQLL
ncbi:efflux RND transporter periplasmic adaptor subunit [uncultured Xylophilus sp.]|uniref:efflux RND transporter periplasmic adaptor subunit n=1 Tax=uncultured Xylophilus sp. TaxID=296832 RepID=UPI0025FAB521|nr:efflux RND transporter periplasmic adaptor subunit [uncultured Xylophilus sp.]